MLENLKLLRDGGIYTLTNLLNSLIPFLLLPAYTQSLTPADFGVLNIYENFLIFFMPLLMFGVSGVLSVDYFRKARIFSYLFSSAFFIPAAIFIIFCLAATLFKTTGYKNQYLDYSYVYIVLLVAFMQVVTLLRLMLFQVKKEPIKYLFLQGWVILSGVLLTLYLVIFNHGGWQGRLNALFFAYSAAGIFSILSFIKEGYLSYVKVVLRKIRYVLKIGAPLVPHAIGMLVIVYFDRFLLAHYWGAEEVGIYAVAHQLGMGISLVQNSFNQAWCPRFFELYSRNKINEIRLVHRLFLLFLIISICALYIIVDLSFDFLFSQSYAEAKNFFIVIAIGFAFTGLYKVFVNVIFYQKKTRVLAYFSLGNVLINVSVNFLLIPSMGALGAAFSLLVSMIFLFCANKFYVHRFITAERLF